MASALARGDPAEIESLIGALFSAADHTYFLVDLEQRRVLWSRKIELDLGSAETDLDTWIARIHPEDRERAEGVRAEAFLTTADALRSDLRIRHVDGRYVAVRVTARLLREKGRVIGLVGLLDTTAVAAEDEQHRRYDEIVAARQETSRTEQRRELLTRAVEDATYEWDAGRDVVTFGDAAQRLFGYGPDAVENAYAWWLDRVHPDDRAGVEERVRGLMAEGADGSSGTYRFRRHDGSYVVVSDRAFGIRDLTGAVDHVVGAMHLVRSAPDAERPVVRLTRRQARVLDLVRGGHSNKEIATELGIGEQSVKEHVTRLLRRFGTPNRASLATAAARTRIEVS